MQTIDVFLTFTTLWANSEDNILKIFSQKIGFQISCRNVKCHEMAEPILWEKDFKTSSAEISQSTKW